LSLGTYGIDLGTDSIKIYSSGTGKIYTERNIIAIQNKTKLFAYGDDAYEMYEKAPSNIHIFRPLSNGVIGDIKSMQSLLKLFLDKISKEGIKPAEYYIAIPSDVTEVEQRAFYDLVKSANVKAKKICVVDKAIADALGVGVNVKTSEGVLVVNVGFDTTEVSILSLGGIVLSKLIKMGGNKFDDTIKNVIRKEYGLLIGSKSAEILKQSLNEISYGEKEPVVFGRDIVTGLPVEKKIEPKLIDDVLKENFNTIIDSVKVILERTPPELSADIYRNGIYLTGAASSVKNLAELLNKGTNLKVNISEDPAGSVARGLEEIIKNKEFKSLAYEFEGMNR
jgi:rod shape-determining protein MreB